MTNLDELERLAKAATPGPWRKIECAYACYEIGHDHSGAGTVEVTATTIVRRNAAFIAAFNPASVLELIRRAREGESYKRMFEAACSDLGLINEHLGLDPNDGGCDPIIGAIENLEGQRDGLLAALSDIKHRSEMMRIWTGQEWKYHPFHASVIHKFAEDAIAKHKDQST